MDDIQSEVSKSKLDASTSSNFESVDELVDAIPIKSSPLEAAFVIELCCGTAGFTASVQHAGFRDSFGVEHIRPAAILCLDMTVGDSQRLILRWLDNPNCRGVLIGPPCGTASAARNIRLDHLPGGGPRVLRTKEEPEGIYPLSPQYRARVEQANRLYCFVQENGEKRAIKGIPLVVENPMNSLYWDTRWWKTHRCASQSFMPGIRRVHMVANVQRILCWRSTAQLSWRSTLCALVITNTSHGGSLGENGPRAWRSTTRMNMSSAVIRVSRYFPKVLNYFAMLERGRVMTKKISVNKPGGFRGA